MLVHANNRSASFYKDAINAVPGYEAFLPEEWPTANPIYCTLPGVAKMVLPELAAHFAAGTYGGVRENQVRVPRAAWKPAGDTESYRVYLEIDDEALEWLKRQNYKSYIGLFLVRWEHPPVRGLTGRIDPGSKLDELLDELEGSSKPAPPPAQTQVMTTMVTQERSRHVTGESRPGSSKQPTKPVAAEKNEEKKEEEELLQGDTFLAELTPAIEREMLETCQIPVSPRPDNLDTTVVHTPEPRSSTPQPRSAKSRRKRKPDGEYQNDVSETESEGFNSVD